MGGTIRSRKQANEQNNHPSPPTTPLNITVRYIILIHTSHSITLQTQIQIHIEMQMHIKIKYKYNQRS